MGLLPLSVACRYYSDSEEFTYAEVPVFFKSASYFYLSSFVKYNESACLQNKPQCVSSFFFMTNFHNVSLAKKRRL